MLSHLDIATVHSLSDSIISFTIVFVISNAIRIFLKPLASEAKLIAKIFAGVTLIVIRWARRGIKDHHTPHLNNVSNSLASLRESLKKDKINALG